MKKKMTKSSEAMDPISNPEWSEEGSEYLPKIKPERPLVAYPDSTEKVFSESFEAILPRKLSWEEKIFLESCSNKWLYYCMVDLSDSFDPNSSSGTLLSGILKEPFLALHNSSSISFWDIWIGCILFPEKDVFYYHSLSSSDRGISETIYSVQLNLFFRKKELPQPRKKRW